MKITFVANFMNHHQLPFSKAMLELTNNQYCFVAFEDLPEERASMGYENMNMLPFVIRAYENRVMYDETMGHILNDDMVIFGTCPDEVVYERYKTGKPFIMYSERFFKKGIYRRFIPMTYKKIKNRLLRYEGGNVSVICSSAYLPYDLKLLNSNFQTYKWGYFPQVKKYESIEKIIELKHPASILWVARLIELKHPEAPILVAKKLKEQGYAFNIKLIGNGKLESKLQGMINKYGLDDCVHLLGAMSPEKVREHMEASRIFMFTSDRNEGWGAVMNEAMNSGCAVVASHSIGSVPFLVQDGVNGFIYRNGDIDDLTEKIKTLLVSPEKQKQFGLNAYATISGEWSAEVAAERLFEISKAKCFNRTEPVFENGPCSVASVIIPKYRSTK